MEELWRKLSELMVQRPLLWLPVLVADLLAFLIGLGSKAWVGHILARQLETRSVLGGPAMSVHLNASAVQRAVQAVTPIEWGASLLRLLLYTLAFLMTVALVRAFRARNERPLEEIGPVLRRHFLALLPVAGTALLVYLITAALAKFVSDLLVRGGHKAVLLGGAAFGGWFGLGVGLLTLALLGTLVAPAAIQSLSQRPLDPAHRQQSQVLALSLGFVALMLGRFVQANLLSLRGAGPVARDLLGITGSWIAALPYAVLFAGLGMLAIKAGWGMEAHTELDSRRE